jgi:hypothetical protein
MIIAKASSDPELADKLMAAVVRQWSDASDSHPTA